MNKQTNTRWGRPIGLTEWLVLVAIVALIVSLWGGPSKGGEYEPFNQGTGTVVADAALCFSTDLNGDVIKLLAAWQEAVDALEASEKGGPPLTENMKIFGQAVIDNNLCSGVNDAYPVFILRQGQGHVLANFTDVGGMSFVVAEGDVIINADDPEAL